MKRYLLMLMTAALVNGSEPPKDLDGWRDARGMSKADVLKAFKSEVIEIEPKLDNKGRMQVPRFVGIPEFKVEDVRVKAWFIFDNRGTGGLNSVQLTPFFANTNNNIAVESALCPPERDTFYKTLYPLLVEKYGKPTFEDHLTSLGDIWKFPHTTIKFDMRSCVIVFRPTSTDSDKL